MYIDYSNHYIHLHQGVNIGDFKENNKRFIDLIRELDKVDGIERYRISSIEPNLITCDFHEFSNMQKKLEELNIDIQNSELQRIPLNTKKISAEEAEKVIKLLDLLEENDDVQQVFHNMELTEEILLAMEN